MFQTNFLQDGQSYLVADYDPLSLTIGVLTFKNRKPHIEHCVRSFFGPDERTFHPRVFERNFLQSCQELEKKSWKLPTDVCVFLDSGKSIATSTGYTFSREEEDAPITLEEINEYATNLREQSSHQAQKIWTEESGYSDKERKLISIFLSYFALDKKYHVFPLGKKASHITMRCLFFYGEQTLLDGISRSIRSAGYNLLTCVPLPLLFLNHICNQKTFLKNHLHIHLWYDATTVVLHLGKHIQEIQIIPFGWQLLDDALSLHFSPLERESFLMGSEYHIIAQRPEVIQYTSFLSASLRVLFERFWLQWSFTDYSVSSVWPAQIIHTIVKAGELSPWIQKNSSHERFGIDPTRHWLQYCDTLDPLFSLHPHPLLALVRSVFIPPHAE